MTLLLANNATSTLTTAISAGATTLLVQTADAALFPAITTVGDYFLAVLEDTSVSPVVREIVKITARTSNSLTAVRGQEGTTAHTFPSGASLSLRLTAGTMAALIAQAVVTIKGYPGILRIIEDLESEVDPDGVVYAEDQIGLYVGTYTLYRRNGLEWTNLISASELVGQISSTQITNGAVTAPKVAANAVTTAKLDAADVKANFLQAQTAYVNTGQIIDAAITNAKVGTLAVDTANVINGAITNAKIGTLAVDTAQIAAAAITDAKIDNLAVKTAHIDNLAVDTIKIAGNAVTDGVSATNTSPRTLTSGTGDFEVDSGHSTVAISLSVSVTDAAYHVFLIGKVIIAPDAGGGSPPSGGEGGV